MIRKMFAGGAGVVILALGLVVPAWNAQARLPSDLFVQLEEGQPVPVLTLEASARHGRWWLEIEADGFVFTEVCTTVDRPELIGHAHVYKDGQKVAGAYVPVVDLGPLAPGVHAFEVILRAQDHRVLAGPGGAVAATIEIRVPETQRPPEGGPA